MSGRYPGAVWRPIRVNYSGGTAEPNKLDITHIMQGSLWGTDSWFRNPAAQASAHFGVGFDGTVFQWVDCNHMAWHACNANGRSIGVETEGMSGQPFTTQQVRALAKILRWAHGEYSIPLWVNIRPGTGSGLSWHGLGGSDWCGHPACPGTPRVRALPDIVARAKSL